MYLDCLLFYLKRSIVHMYLCDRYYNYQGGMYFEDELTVPALVPIKANKKKHEVLAEEPENNLNRDVMEVFAREFDRMQPER